MAAVVEICKNIVKLHVPCCGLTALPENIGTLSKLRSLNVCNNSIEELPRSIAELDASCEIIVRANSLLRVPPYEIAEDGIPAIRQYFEELDGEATA